MKIIQKMKKNGKKSVEMEPTFSDNNIPKFSEINKHRNSEGTSSQSEYTNVINTNDRIYVNTSQSEIKTPPPNEYDQYPKEQLSSYNEKEQSTRYNEF